MPGKFSWDEIAAKYPAVISLVTSIASAVSAAKSDGKLSGEEIGQVLAIAGPPLGKLIDEVIEDLKD